MGLVESHSQLVVVSYPWTQGSGVAFTGTTASVLPITTQVASHIFTADRGYQVVSVLERHSVAGSTTIMLVGALGSTPVGSGTNLLGSTISTFSAVNIPNGGVLLGSAVLSASTVLGSTATGPVLGSGDALGIVYGSSGSLQPVGTLQVILQTL